MTNTFAMFALAAWSALLTVGVLACIRQIVTLGVRADTAMYDGQDPHDDGPLIGSPVPDSVLDLFEEDLAAEGPSFLLLLSSTCTTCRDVLQELVDFEPDAPLTIMVAGADENVNGWVHPSFLERYRVVTEPKSSEIPGSIDLNTVPFVLEIRRDVFVAKAAIRGFDHLKRFIDEASVVSDSEVQILKMNENQGEAVVQHVIVD